MTIAARGATARCNRLQHDGASDVPANCRALSFDSHEFAHRCAPHQAAPPCGFSSGAMQELQRVTVAL
jgi:hypothetical protein